MEAWYLCGRDASVTEAAWVDGQVAGRLPCTRGELKWRVYGTERPTLPHEIRRAVQELSRHHGDVRRWKMILPKASARSSGICGAGSAGRANRPR